MPKKSVEKMKIGNGNAADEKFVQENFFIDQLPAFLGGGQKGGLPAELDGSLLGKITFALDDGDKAVGMSSNGCKCGEGESTLLLLAPTHELMPTPPFNSQTR